MKLLLLQLSDIHLSNKDDVSSLNVDKVVQALNKLGTLDECIIIISGDITKNGYINEFKIARTMIGNLVNRLKEKKFLGKDIRVFTVPGNHDLDLTHNNRTFEDIIESSKKGTINYLIDQDINSLKNFYSFADYNQCFMENKIVSHKIVKILDTKLDFTLLNTAIFSLKGGSNKDKGIHYLSNEDLSRVIPKSKSDVNIIVMHHSFEWFVVKEKLRDILSENFSLVMEGHEHDGHGETRRINNGHSIIFLQGNSLSGDKEHEKGFNTIVYDTEKNSIKATSYIWNDDYYRGTEILSETLMGKVKSPFVNTEDFIKYLDIDDNGNVINHYFVFPALSYTITKANNELETKLIDDENSFVKTVLTNFRTIISGDSRSGKSTLSKILYKCLSDNEEGLIPLLLIGGDLKNKKVDRIVEYAFKNQYKENNNSYDKFLLLESNKRILIIDDAGKIVKTYLNKILDEYNDMFDKIVLFSEQEIDLNIKKRVIDQLTDKQVEYLSIRPFLYDKRKILISKAYDQSHLPEDENKRNQIIYELNNMISSQIRFFKLNPEFIINFVLQYSEKFKLDFSPQSNIFNMIYENSIKTRIINVIDAANVSSIFWALQEIAFYMRFNQKPWINSSELGQIIEMYNKEYRQTVKLSHILEVGNKAKIFIEQGTQIRFKDNNLFSYFVAQALNRKFHQNEDDINTKFEEVLNKLCFGINSDIVLFLALITSNPVAINIILDCATKHFENMEELSFDKNNISLLCESDFKVKTTLPDEKEKKEKEQCLVKYEQDITSSDVVELVDEYNYDEENILSFENQLLISLKYLEILSKILPAFGHNMKAAQQDKLVQALYKYPNKFIYQLLHEISENLDEFIEGIYEEAYDIRKEKNIAELNIEDIKRKLEEMAITFVVAIYMAMATSTSTKQTISALNAFDYQNNSNYLIMNLMMNEKAGDIKSFSDKAIKIYHGSQIKLIKALVRFTVRNYFLDHDVKIVNEVQALLDNVFGDFEKQEIKNGIVRNKIKALQR